MAWNSPITVSSGYTEFTLDYECFDGQCQSFSVIGRVHETLWGANRHITLRTASFIALESDSTRLDLEDCREASK